MRDDGLVTERRHGGNKTENHEHAADEHFREREGFPAVPGLMRFCARHGYFTNWDILKMGKRIAAAIKATIPPIKTIMSGSMADVTVLMVAFNSRS